MPIKHIHSAFDDKMDTDFGNIDSDAILTEDNIHPDVGGGANAMTTDTEQTITGVKKYNATQEINNNNIIKLHALGNVSAIDLNYDYLAFFHRLTDKTLANDITGLWNYENGLNVKDNSSIALFNADNSASIDFNHTELNTIDLRITDNADNLETLGDDIVDIQNNYVTTNTPQTITSNKTISGLQQHTDHLRMMNNKRIDLFNIDNSVYSSLTKDKIDKIDDAVLKNQNATLTGQYTFTSLNGIHCRNINMNQLAELVMKDANNQNPVYLRYAKLQELEARTIPLPSSWTTLTIATGYQVKTQLGRASSVAYKVVDYGSNVKQVFLRGAIEPTSGSFPTTGVVNNIVQMPGGVRPSHLHDFICPSGDNRGSFAHLLIYAGGNVAVWCDKTNDGNNETTVDGIEYISLDGVSFWTN